MDLLFYASDTEDIGNPLWKLFQGLEYPYKREFFLKVDDFVNRLRRPISDPAIAVILVANYEDLEAFLAIRDLLDRVRTILILPDRNKDTINKGLALFPRFLTHVDGNFDWVEEVLHKMLSNNNNNNRLG